MKVSKKIKQTAAALIAAAGLAVVGLPATASAMSIANGDFGFYVYGGNTERYENLGTGSTAALAGGGSFSSDIATSLSTLLDGATLGLRYSLIGVDAAGANMYFSSASSTLTPTMIENSFPDVAAGNFLQWAQSFLPFQTGGDGLVNNPSLVSKASANSFTSILGVNGLLNGNMGVVTHGVLGSTLNIFKVNIDGDVPNFQFVTTASLGQNGLLQVGQVAPIPVPAAVYLFGTGLIGLVGLARRSMNKNKMAA
jgi:hypothetical protein